MVKGADRNSCTGALLALAEWSKLHPFLSSWGVRAAIEVLRFNINETTGLVINCIFITDNGRCELGHDFRSQVRGEQM